MTTTTPSALLQYLPAIYHEDPFLGRFLAAFEKVLLGRTDDVAFSCRGLEEIIADIAALFDPIDPIKHTPKKFLPWLASWTALTLRGDLNEQQQRHFIANIIPRYRGRGTKKNLEELLTIFIAAIGPPILRAPTVSEAAEFQIGAHSTIGQDTYLGGAPHFFRVSVVLPRSAPEIQTRQRKIARALIELEKPAHTYYQLDVIFPTMQLTPTGVQVGVDTLLGVIIDTHMLKRN